MLFGRYILLCYITYVCLFVFIILHLLFVCFVVVCFGILLFVYCILLVAIGYIYNIYLYCFYFVWGVLLCKNTVFVPNFVLILLFFVFILVCIGWCVLLYFMLFVVLCCGVVLCIVLLVMRCGFASFGCVYNRLKCITFYILLVSLLLYYLLLLYLSLTNSYYS